MSDARDVAAAEWRPRANPWLIALSVMLGTFMEVLDSSVANVALPHIAGNLSASTDEATWVLTSYLVSNAIILPTTGWLAGHFGRKRLLLVCMLIFTLSSVLAGVSASLGMLIVARVLQGVGGGALQPIAQAVLLESFPPARHGVAMGVYGIGVVVAPIVGPTLGGWITDNYSWRWIFYINLPTGLLAMLMVKTFVEDPPYVKKLRSTIDYIGFGLMAIGIGALQIILDKGQEDDWFSASWIRWFAVVSALTLVAFVARELTTREPLVDLRVLLNRNFALGTALIGVVGLVLYGTTAMLPLFLQTLLGYPALDSGLAVSPRGFGSIAAMLVVGRAVGVVDSRLLIAIGFGLVAVSSFALGHLSLDIGMVNVIVPNIINGVALGFLFVPLTTVAMGTLRQEQIGNATGIYNLMRNLGGSFGISAVTTLLARRAQGHQAMLAAHVTPYDAAAFGWLERVTAALTPRVGAVTAGRQALGLLYAAVVKQATLLAFVDTFRVLGFVSLVCIPSVLLLRRARAVRRAAAH